MTRPKPDGTGGGEAPGLGAPTEPTGPAVPAAVDAAAGTHSGYVAALKRYFSKRVAPGEIDDLVQEVFVRMQVRGAQLPAEELDRYLFTVAASALSDRARRRAVRRADAHESLEESHHPVDDLTPERVLLDREALDGIVATIADLPQRTREVFVLHRFEELTCKTIAEQIGISVSAVEKHIMKAMCRLHERLRS